MCVCVAGGYAMQDAIWDFAVTFECGVPSAEDMVTALSGHFLLQWAEESEPFLLPGQQ